MLKIFRPEFSGTYSPQSLRSDFLAAIAERVRRGLFPRASERRNRYAVVTESEEELRFRSEGFLAAISSGWNDVHVRIDSAPGSPPNVRYDVRYFAWARYSVAFCALIAVGLIAGWSLYGARFGAGQSAANTIFWIVVFFWGFVWPWILVAIHRRPATRALERLLAAVNEEKS